MSVFLRLIAVSALAPHSGRLCWITLPCAAGNRVPLDVVHSHRGVWLCGNCQTVGITERMQEKPECCMLNLTLNIPILKDTIRMMMKLIQIKELSLWVNLSCCEIGGPECSSVFSRPWRPAPSVIHTEEGVLRGAGLRLSLSTTWRENRLSAPWKISSRSVAR